MKFKYSFCIAFIVSIFMTYASQAALRISLLTCGVGEELYASFGHSAIRIVDSANGTDKVYNYGMFDFGDPNFYSKFTRGKLLYYADEENYLSFINIYEHERRSITEQILRLDSGQAQQLLKALQENIQPQNKFYKYDFLFDNCSTRIRDIFAKALGSSFKYATDSSTDSLTFMTILNRYLTQKHWERLGIDLMLVNKVNEKMTTQQSMFLPDGLMEGVERATINGQPFVLSTQPILLDGSLQLSDNKNMPLILLSLFAAVYIVMSILFKKNKALLFIDLLLLLLIGLIGALFLFMWIGTDHITTYRNYNLLWASPLLIILGIGISRNAKWVKTLAITCFITSCIALIYFFLMRKYIPIEIVPILLLLIYRLSHYAKSRSNTTTTH